MNIVFYFVDSFDPEKGGIGRVSCNLAKNFVEKGHSVCFVTLSDEKYTPIGKQLILDRKEICLESNISKFSDFVIENKVDIIISQSSYNDSHITELPYFVKKRTGAKLLFVFHSTPMYSALALSETSSPIVPTEKTFSKQYRRIMRRLLKKQKQQSRNRKVGKLVKYLSEISEGVVFLASQYIGEAQKISGVFTENKFFAIGNSNTYAWEDVNLSEEKENTILFVGRLSLEKRPEKSLLLWKNIQHQYPDWNMKIVGDGILKNDLQILIDKFQLERCSLEGFQNPKPYYEKAKIIVVPSDYEGFGMSITEAMQHKVVPVAFNTYSALPDIIEDGITGMCVKPYDLKEFQQKLQILMDNDPLRLAMAEKANETVRRFDETKIGQQWELLLQKLLKV